MDSDRFDALTRFLAARPSRRRLLRGLAGGALAALAGRGAGAAAQAGCGIPGESCSLSGPPCCTGSVCRPRGGTGDYVCVPAEPASLGGGCAALGGECAATADCCAGLACMEGFCLPCQGAGDPCVSGIVDCCAGLTCGADGTCQGLLGSGGGGTCASSADCSGQSCCGGACTDTSSDPANCGSCGTNCAALLSIYHGPYGCSGGFCCFELNGSCASNADCCDPSAVCSGITRGNPIGFCCLPSGSACNSDTDCCSDACFGTCL